MNPIDALFLFWARRGNSAGARPRIGLVIGRKPKTNDRETIWCDTKFELDMHTVVWTRGDAFPLEQLASRLKCPKCGSRKVTLVFSVPKQPIGQVKEDPSHALRTMLRSVLYDEDVGSVAIKNFRDAFETTLLLSRTADFPYSPIDRRLMTFK